MHLLEVGHDILVRHHDAGRRDESSPRCTAAAPFSSASVSARVERRRRIEVERVDLDHCRRRAGERMRTRDDVVDDSRCGQDCGRRAVAQRRGNPFVDALPNNGTDSGTAMSPASIAPRKPTMYSRPCGARIATRSPGDPQRRDFRGDYLHPPVELRPRQLSGIPAGVDLVVDERVRGRIGLLPDLFA